MMCIAGYCLNVSFNVPLVYKGPVFGIQRESAWKGATIDRIAAPALHASWRHTAKQFSLPVARRSCSIFTGPPLNVGRLSGRWAAKKISRQK